MKTRMTDERWREGGRPAAKLTATGEAHWRREEEGKERGKVKKEKKVQSPQKYG